MVQSVLETSTLTQHSGPTQLTAHIDGSQSWQGERRRSAVSGAVSHAVDGGVEPAAACRQQVPALSQAARRGEGGQQRTAAHDRLPACRLSLWRCSSHDSLAHRPASPSAAAASSTDTASSSHSTLETVDSGALLRVPRPPRRASRSDHRLTAGLRPPVEARLSAVRPEMRSASAGNVVVRAAVLRFTS